MNKRNIFLSILFTVFCYNSYGQSIDDIPEFTTGANVITTDVQCNIYLAGLEGYGCDVFKIDATTGRETIIAGTYHYDHTWEDCGSLTGMGGPATSALLGTITALAVDLGGDVFIADAENNVIEMVDGSGNLTVIAGTLGSAGNTGNGGSAASATLQGITALVYDGSSYPGFLYVTDNVDHVVRKITQPQYHATIDAFAGTSGTVGYSGDGHPAASAEISDPQALAVDDIGDVFILDAGNHNIREVSSGVITTVIGTATGSIGSLPGLGSEALSTSNGLTSGFTDGLSTMALYQSKLYFANFSNTYDIDLSANTVNLITSSLGSPIAISNSGNMWEGDSYDEIGLNELCVGTPSGVTLTCNPSTVSCAHSANPVLTASIVNGCNQAGSYSWYASIDGGATYSLIAYTTTNQLTLTSAVNGEMVYCVANLESFANPCGTLVTSNTEIVFISNLQIADVDINTLCAPGTTFPDVAADASDPVYTVTATGGHTPYTYNWVAELTTNTVLTTTSTSPTATIISLTSGATAPFISYYLLTVTDADGCTAIRYVHTQLNQIESYDLASRDSHYDMYDEPNSQATWPNSVSVSSDFFSSPDIVNRLYDNTGVFINEPAVYTGPYIGTTDNYINVKIRNVGCMNYYADRVSGYKAPNINLYWTIGGFGEAEAWPAAWNGSDALPGYPGPEPQGWQIIDSQTIPSINAGSYIIYAPSPSSYPYGTPWSVPNPQVYDSAFSLHLTGTPNEMDLCFLSRIVDYHNTTPTTPPALPADLTYGMTYTEATGPTADPAYAVIKNNNIVTMNTGVIYIKSYPLTSPGPGPGPNPNGNHYLFVGNLQGTAQYSLKFVNDNNVPNVAGSSTLSNFAYFKVYLGAALFDAWLSAGSYGANVSYDQTDSSILFDGSDSVQLDSITIDSGAQYIIRIAAYTVAGAETSAMPCERINFREIHDDSIGTVCGNYSYKVKYKAGNPQGVLAVTEISQGPYLDGGTGGQYAEIIVGNCGNDASLDVNVGGWILDDNSGIFDTGGCSQYGITRGHYRLSPTSPVWQNIRVGSLIIIYDAAQNFYNLPDTFYVDTVNSVYWVPVNATAPVDSYVLEQFAALENADSASFCSDTGATVYTPACCWQQIIALAPEDAFQVRCPGCTTAYPGTPPFYNGIGYVPNNSYCFVPVQAGSNDLGGPLEYNPSFNQKYVFTGSVAADFANPSMWTAYNADAAGSPPSTLGNVDSALFANVFTHQLGLPCCSYSGDGQRITKNTKPAPVNTVQNILVYPNPATMTVFFQFPAGDVTIKLMNITGQRMAEQEVQNNTSTSFNVQGYAPGIYIYQVVTQGKTQTGKIVVE